MSDVVFPGPLPTGGVSDIKSLVPLDVRHCRTYLVFARLPGSNRFLIGRCGFT
jgi:hypothetical protein